jgi:hypothetical protein
MVALVSLEFMAHSEVDGMHAYVQASCCSLVLLGYKAGL